MAKMIFLKQCPGWLLAACVFLISVFAVSLSNAGVTDDLAPCVVYLQQDVPEGQDANIGSGFLVRSGNAAYLVTAAHVARAVGKRIRIVMPGADGKPVRASLVGAAWRESSQADAAVNRLNIEESHREMILDRCAPIALFSSRELPPSRDIPLTVMGYPLGLGADGYVSPLSIETRAASGFITMRRFDNNQFATFIILQDPSVGGLSGGPVFDTGKGYFAGGRKMITREGVSIVGLIHGVIFDKTGGKFTAVVPSTEIVRLIGE